MRKSERRFVTFVNKETDGILIARDTDEKDGDLLKETPASKFPEAKDVDVGSLPQFDFCSTLIEIIVMEKSREGGKTYYRISRTIRY